MVVDYLEGIIVAAINLKEGNKTLIVFTRIINKASFVEELSRSLFIKVTNKKWFCIVKYYWNPKSTFIRLFYRRKNTGNVFWKAKRYPRETLSVRL